MRHRAALVDSDSYRPGGLSICLSLPTRNEAIIPPRMVVKMRYNELKWLLAAVISVINQIKIVRSEEQKKEL